MEKLELTLEIHIIVCSIVMGLYLYITRRNDRTAKVMVLVLADNVLNLLSDMGAILFHGRIGQPAWLMVRVSNFTLYFFQHLLYALMAVYIYEVLKKEVSDHQYDWVKAVFLLSGIGLILLFLTPFTGWCYTIDAENVYHRGPMFLVIMILGLASSAITILQIVRYYRKLPRTERWALILYYVFPMVGAVCQIIWYGFSFMNIGVGVSVLILVGESSFRQYKIRKNQEIRLAQNRAYLLNSQIKPHFMFNSLSVIQALIEEDPDTAYDAIGHFSRFLREGMNLRVNEGLIPVSEELEYTKNYLYMEKLRFDDKLNIVYDIDEDANFTIPFLTIQPLAENAVRHGIRKKREGGTLIIRVWKENGQGRVQITDNGVGFDPEEAAHEAEERRKRSLSDPEYMNESNGIGMLNVQERIRIMAEGTMTIDSAPGKGTTITIRLPKQHGTW